MKHTLKITLILLAMFLITQLIGLFVIDFYSQNQLPYGMDSPSPENQSEFVASFSSILLAFIIAVILFLLLTKFKITFVLRLWFFLVIILALAISFNSAIFPIKYAGIVALILALPLAFFKVYKQTFFIHNATELFIYPGIAAIFVPLLNVYTIIALLILISVYDMWAVWHSGIMQKMANYQINKLKTFSGFFVPYLSKKDKIKIKKLKKSKSKNKSIKVNIAILGGGDVIFPIITAGVMFTTYGLASALFVIVGAMSGLSYLFFFAKKKKFYPAMPFISIGIFVAMALSYFLL